MHVHKCGFRFQHRHGRRLGARNVDLAGAIVSGWFRVDGHHPMMFGRAWRSQRALDDYRMMVRLCARMLENGDRTGSYEQTRATMIALRDRESVSVEDN
jgi:hypothetical protein